MKLPYILLWVISASVAEICPRGEYQINDVCCPMCPKGTVVKIHCTLQSSSSVCIPCVDGTYMDHPNGVTKCLKCRECDTGAGLLEINKCTYTSDTQCECKPGYYCAGEGSSCDLCIPQTTCNPGQYIKKQGTSRADNVCEKCPDGHYSSGNMSKACTPWTKCSEHGLVETEQGTKIADSVCVDKRKYYSTFISLSFFFVGVLFLLLFWCRYQGSLLKLSQPVQVQDI